jgi:hypothetical protein
VHARSVGDADAAIAAIHGACAIVDGEVSPPPLELDWFGPDGAEGG